jgi:hypothetical protein
VVVRGQHVLDDGLLAGGEAGRRRHGM